MEKPKQSVKVIRAQILQEALECHDCDDCSFRKECEEYVRDHDMDFCLEMLHEFEAINRWNRGFKNGN